MADRPTTVDEYVSGFPDDVRPILEQVRASIRAAIPDAPETMSYGMPTYRLGGRHAIYFGGWKKHVGIYPVYRGDEAFEALVGPYRAATDALHFPYAKPVPDDLIATVARAMAAHAQS